MKTQIRDYGSNIFSPFFTFEIKKLKNFLFLILNKIYRLKEQVLGNAAIEWFLGFVRARVLGFHLA
jgi:hypothetical protein